MPYCKYIRKSRADLEAETRGEGETLARHDKNLTALAKRLNLEVTATYREIVSGDTIAARPQMQQLLLEVEQGLWDGVLVMEVERLARGDTIDQGIVAQAFKYSGTKIITPMKTYDPADEFDEEYFEFGLFMSRREYKTINRRLQRGRLASIREGKFVGNKAPYGYRRIKLADQSGWTLEPVENQAEVVRSIFFAYVGGLQQPDGTVKQVGTKLIARHLNEHSTPPPAASPWAPSAITGILRNPAYIGKIKWGGRPQEKKVQNGEVVVSRPRKKLGEDNLYNGLHPAIVSEELYQAAAERMGRNTMHHVPIKYNIQNPIAGLIICSKCGHKMVRRPYSDGRSPVGLICTTDGCEVAGAPLHLVEAAVLRALREQLQTITVSAESGVAPILTADKAAQKILKDQKDSLATLKKQIGNLYDLLEQGLYDKEIYLQRNKLLSEKIATVEKIIEQLEREMAQKEQQRKIQSDIIPRIEHVLDAYEHTDDADKRNNLLKSVIDYVSYYKAPGGRWRVAPDDFTLELFVRL